ncbi:hypothetical protein A2U01_0105886, partial [Trifolium medium]|nr:hypothetical protein [Trifolium medium]
MPGSDDPALAEACAMYQAVQLAIDCCFHEVVFESDNNRTLIDLVKEGNRIPKS